MKKNRTARALLMSALSLLLCVSMLVGSTFAWFTDSVTSGRNTIQSGNLDVVLEYWDGNSYEEVTSTTKLFDDAALWEPGYTEVAYLKVSNAGSLALKYQLAVDVYDEIIGKTETGADIKLSDYLQFKVVESDTDLVGTYATREEAQAAPATATKLQTYSSDVKPLDPKDAANDEDYVALIIYMPTTVGNEANHDGVNVPKIEMGVNLFATQFTYESDSFNDQYDKDAEFSVDVKNADELANVLKVGGKVKLVGDIQLSNPVEVPADVTVVMELNGYTITSEKSNVIKNYGTLTITNGVLDATTAYTVNNAGGNVTIKNVKSVDAGFYNAGTMLVEDCEITNTISGRHGLYNNANATLVINGLVCSTTSQNAIIYNNNGKVTVNDGAFTQIGSSYMLDGSNITINGGTFTDDDGTWAIRGNGHAIKGGTFNFNPNNYVAPGYQVANNGDGTYTVGAYEISTGAELVDAIANGKAVKLTQDVSLGKINLTDAITNDVVIDANGHKITTTDAYGIEVTAGKNVTISNADVQMTKEGDYITYAAGFKIANGDYAGSTITLKDCTITMANTDWAYAVTMPASVKNLNLVIDNCTLEGAVAVQCWGDNNTITITNSKLICNYTTSALYTSYCVVLQAEGSNKAENNTLVIDNCEFQYSGIDNFNSKIYSVVDRGNGATGNTVTVTNCTYGEKVVAG